MKNMVYVLVLLVTMSAVTFAQSNSNQSSQSSGSGSNRRGYGYVFAAPGIVTDGDYGTGTLHFGVGGEGLVKGGFGLGGEIGVLAPTESFRGGFGVLSAGANYHFLNASKSGKVVPFVNGGYTMFFSSGVASGVHFGGGVNYWFKERVGLRFEVRDHVAAEVAGTHFLGFRFGLTFR